MAARPEQMASCRYVPVSYTHLDVYKRQVKAHAVDALRAEITEPGAGFALFRKIGLTEHKQMTLIWDHIGQIRIPAGAGNARVAKLDDHIDAAEPVSYTHLPSIAPLDVMETTGITLPFPSAAATSQSAEPAPSNVRRI